MATRWLRCKKCGHTEICPVNVEVESCGYCAKGIKISEIIEMLQKSIEEHGDLPVKMKANILANSCDIVDLEVRYIAQNENSHFDLRF